MKRLFLAVSITVALAGCASNGTGTQIDYQTLAKNACGLATSEVAALQSVQSDLSANDQKTLATVAPLVSTACNDLTQITTEDSYTAITAIVTQLTVLVVTYHVSPGAQ